MSDDFTLDVSQFRDAMKLYGQATKRDEEYILNRAGRNVAGRAITFTPRATAAGIKAELARDNRAIYATIRRLKRAGISQRGMSRAQFANEVNKTISQRARSASYIRAGWLKPREALGGPAAKVSARGNAAKSTGRKATASNLSAELVNRATGAEIVGAEGLQEAVNYVANDMATFAMLRLAETAAKHSAR